MDRRSFLRGALPDDSGERVQLSRREFTLLALLLSIIAAFLPEELARKLMADVCAKPPRLRASDLTSFDAALKKMYPSKLIDSLLYAQTPMWRMLRAEQP